MNDIMREKLIYMNEKLMYDNSQGSRIVKYGEKISKLIPIIL